MPDVRAVVIDLGRLLGSHPTPRRPLPGAKNIWQGLARLNWAIQVRDSPGEGRRSEAPGERKRKRDPHMHVGR